jgi:hypothetical protein
MLLFIILIILILFVGLLNLIINTITYILIYKQTDVIIKFMLWILVFIIVFNYFK